ncbi:SDR family NAD(P)-dependent oxidoreductase [Mesorhizobium sp. CAU 1741]|uniref:SDR family NAD(P)-dependent oxidoreductase n=1 Tax=Mesorhizobium sp. CAU 1741 TaxID=3140366 RepID=UPI00325BDF54
MTDKIHPVSGLLDLSGKTALVTGASGGIGAGIARRFAEAGANVVCHYNANRAAADSVVAAISEAGGTAIAMQADISGEAGAAKLVSNAAAHFGGLDILVNNAGLQPAKALAEVSEADWNEMMAANAAGPFLLVQAMVALLRQAGKGGSIVNIASIEGHHPAPWHGHYATSKAALLMFTKAAALEFGEHGIRVNAVCPGLIHRDGIEEGWPEGVARWTAAAPLKRLGQPEDIADACLFLASDAARWITGADLVVDGGVLTRPTW